MPDNTEQQLPTREAWADLVTAHRADRECECNWKGIDGCEHTAATGYALDAAMESAGEEWDR